MRAAGYTSNSTSFGGGETYERGWRLPSWIAAGETMRRKLVRIAGFKIALLDFTIGLARKVAGFGALLALGWMFLSLLILDESLRQVFPGAADPALRATLYMAVFLVLAQGWDIPTPQLVGYWRTLRAYLPVRERSAGGHRPRRIVPLIDAVEPVVAHLGRFTDLVVAVSNKLGALAVLGSLFYLAERLWLAGVSLREMYPTATDPTVSLLADLGVDLLVLGWWATSFEQIGAFWRSFRYPEEPSHP